jgi:hypothetical protein
MQSKGEGCCKLFRVPIPRFDLFRKPQQKVPWVEVVFNALDQWLPSYESRHRVRNGRLLFTSSAWCCSSCLLNFVYRHEVGLLAAPCRQGCFFSAKIALVGAPSPKVQASQFVTELELFGRPPRSGEDTTQPWQPQLLPTKTDNSLQLLETKYAIFVPDPSASVLISLAGFGNWSPPSWSWGMISPSFRLTQDSDGNVACHATTGLTEELPRC